MSTANFVYVEFKDLVSVSPNNHGCFQKWWYPQKHPKMVIFSKKTIVVVYHHFRKPPYESITRPSPYLYPRRSEESALLEDRQSLHDLRQAKAANMGVSKNRDTPKWMVKLMENLIF